jgi:hypothetical protein
MVRFTNILLTYLVIGSVMFGGGAIGWDSVGPAEFFVNEDDGEISPSDKAQENLTGTGGALNSLVDSVAGPVLIIWSIISGLIGFLNWPITVLWVNNAPPVIILLLGMPMTAAFYLSLIRVLKGSA